LDSKTRVANADAQVEAGVGESVMVSQTNTLVTINNIKSCGNYLRISDNQTIILRIRRPGKIQVMEAI
jgi:hypothetical protein